MRYEKMWYDLKRHLITVYRDDIAKDVLLKMAKIECEESKSEFKEEKDNINTYD
ncbi:MAG: hypothetical protein QJR05_11440 [Thermoanaerobacterium sp.]|nr:hypothetical protein [Thermoanaerobacterium sp.]